MSLSILQNLFSKGVTSVAVQTPEMAKLDAFAVYPLNENNLEWISERTKDLKYVGIPKGLNTHWFKSS